MRKLIFLFTIVAGLALNLSASEIWLDGDRFEEIKDKLYEYDRELFHELWPNKDIEWHWMNFYCIPTQLNNRIKESLNKYQEELSFHLTNSQKEKML